MPIGVVPWYLKNVAVPKSLLENLTEKEDKGATLFYPMRIEISGVPSQSPLGGFIA